MGKARTIFIGDIHGCFFGGFLTAYILETGEITQQKSFDVYKKYVFNPELL